MEKMVGVITAAGQGIRLYPRTRELQKSLLSVDGEPILKRNICIMRDQLGISLIYVLVGYKSEQVKDLLKNGEGLGVEIRYLEIEDVQKGLARGILQLEKYINGTFCCMLGDEVYHNSNHFEILNILNKDFSVVCALKEVEHLHVIKKNYSVELKDGVIVALREKPQLLHNNYLGCGTYLFKPDIFDFIRQTPVSAATHRVELTEVIDLVARKKGRVFPFMLKGEYINVNNLDDYNTANYILRATDFNKKKLSLIIPAYNEEASIGYVIDDFKGKVDEILVANNNSTDQTELIARAKGAKVLSGSFRGYGDALKYGMDNAGGDIFILTEADGSFFSRDLEKMLAYLKDADMVLGTRTTKQMIEQAANMNCLLRWGNVIFAKFIELLWIKGEPRLTDVGCTYRGLWKSTYYQIRDSLKSTGPEFSPEMIIEVMRYNKRTIEIPVTYSGRIGGESKFSDNLLANARTALRMFRLICQKKMADIRSKFKL